MVMNKRKKNTRQRGGTTHGWGSMKKHRGAGNRGGRGNAGTGKRGDARKPSIWHNPNYFGKHGFIKQGPTPQIQEISIKTLEQITPKLLKEGIAKDNKDMIELDLENAGYQKLVSQGNVTRAYVISVAYASSKAVEKIQAAKGSVTLKP